MNSIIERIYTEGVETLDDLIDALASDLVLVEPIFPPDKMHGGIIVEAATSKVPATGCILYRVKLAADSSLIGRAVVLRNAALDPIGPATRTKRLVVPREHILAVLAPEV